MKQICKSCERPLGFFDLIFFCRGGCNSAYCSKCVTSPDGASVAEFLKENSLLPNGFFPEIDLPKIETEYSLIKGKSVACRTCVERYAKKILEFNKEVERINQGIIAALSSIDEIEVFPATYKGRVSFNHQSVVKLETPYLRHRQDVETSLKIQAEYYNNDLVFDLVWDKQTDSEAGSGKGTHYFSVWKGVAKSARRR